MKLAMDSAEVQASAVKELLAVSARSMEQAAQSSLGRIIDTRV